MRATKGLGMRDKRRKSASPGSEPAAAAEAAERALSSSRVSSMSREISALMSSTGRKQVRMYGYPGTRGIVDT
jgi:hypothetical protein